jgi:glycosyltransferase involved in cell wall biosynthesis
MNRRLLMIASGFPPSLSVGRLRTLSFCRYLPKFGIQPVVLTTGLPGRFDKNLLKEIPLDTEVHRVGRGDLVDRVAAHVACLKHIGMISKTQGKVHSVVKSAIGLPGHGDYWKKKFLFWPDEAASWQFSVRRKVLALAQRCDVLYSSGPPMTCHLIACRVAKLTGLPWIMDYRDPWMVDLRYPTRLQNWLFWRWERDCVNTCSKLINVNEPRTEAHRMAFSHEPAEKFNTLPNGFDPEDFKDLPKTDNIGPMTITYLGNLYGGRSPEPLIRVMAHLFKSGQLKSDEIRLQLIGEGAERFAALADQLGIGHMIRISGRIDYRQGLSALSMSHVALLLGGYVDVRSTPTKVYEYFFMRKPILAILEKGFLRETIEIAGVPCFSPDEEIKIGNYILSLLDDFRLDRPLPVSCGIPDLHQYSRLANAQRLSEIIHSLIKD